MIESIICLGILLTIIFFSLKVLPKGEYSLNPLAFERTVSIRGILSILVLVHHFSGYSGSILFAPFSHIGYLLVAAFFFISGYGLRFSIEHKKNYLSANSMLHRINKLLIPYWAAVIVCIVLYYMVGIRFSLKQIAISFIHSNDIISSAWYVFELLVLYLFFFISYRAKKHRFLLLLVFTVTFTVVLVFTKVNTVWYRSNFAFLLGVLFFEKSECIIGKIKTINFKKYIILITVEFVILISTLILKKLIYGLNFDLLTMIINQIGSLVFSVLMVTVMMKIKFGNKVLDYIGKISYEVYLTHVCIIGVLNEFFRNRLILFFLLLLIITIGLSAIESYFNKKAIKQIDVLIDKVCK